MPLATWLQQPKNQKLSALLALVGTVTPLAGLHKFYLGQPRWGAAYLLLLWTPIPHVASAAEAVWLLLQDEQAFARRFNGGTAEPAGNPGASGGNSVSVEAIAAAIRELDQLRQDGLVSEYEFEQKRRQLLERIASN